MSFPIPKFDPRDLIKRDSYIIDNYVFRLHHRVGYLILIFGVVFIFGQNYLDGSSMTCSGGNDYDKRFCWLHGATYIGPKLLETIKTSAGRHFDCVDSAEANKGKRLTAYYIWLPFLLIVCMIIVKIPRTLWKEFLEGGTMKSLRPARENNDDDIHKVVQTFKNLREKKQFQKFTLGLVFCEFLNFLSVIACMSIFDAVLDNQFWNYGSSTAHYLNTGESANGNPMCSLFPTVVNCETFKSAAEGSIDNPSNICILSNNLFNMYYFLILWFWWVSLLFLSALNLFFRALQFFVPSFAYTATFFSATTLDTTKLSRFEIPVLNTMKENMSAVDFEKIHDKLTGKEETKEEESNHLLSVDVKKINKD
eukprot:TRINITY_DN2022_c5_g1_i8.p1 TRINITY_DN2022_c5_g1~~TRINITY_DN2022_c5_g1_i8.p1  ORF type:complete len:365 (-),score=79.35 TRINITY_DN2022_c5_g1_i8:24-1118(-)